MRRLVLPGRIEIVLAVALGLLTILLDVATSRPWPPLALDLVACAVAATSARWPRASGAVLGAVLAVYLVIPPGWATMGEYALLIPVLSSGMRGATRLRLVETVAYLLILFGLNVQNAPSLLSATLGSVLYAVLFGVLWLIGNAFVTVTEAERRARDAELVLARQQTALELHDTVARSLSVLVMAAERARLHGSASDQELAFISHTATESVEQLRDVIDVLRSPEDAGMPGPEPTPSLTEVLAGAEADLTRHGFRPSVSVTGQLDRLDPASGRLLGAAAAEALSNVVKHGDPAGSCRVAAHIDGEAAVVEISNAFAPGRTLDSRRNPMGLWALQRRVHRAGGLVTFGPSNQEWLTRVSLPLASAALVRERAE